MEYLSVLIVSTVKMSTVNIKNKKIIYTMKDIN